MTTMHPRLLLALSLGCLIGCGGASTPAIEVQSPSQPAPKMALNIAPASTSAPSSIADLVERLSPTVVTITTVQTANGPAPFDFFSPEGGGPRERQGAGSGFIIDPKGYVITNAHVVRDADEVQVRLHDDSLLAARIIGQDRKLDLALLKLDTKQPLPAVTLGHSELLRVGEQVIAVGNPFGLGHTVTMGIVSAKDRTIGAGPYDDFIQTDASINPGNSGGPLFNVRGEVIGINTAIRAGADGIGFAIPVDALKDVVSQLRDKGFVERGKLGLAFQPVTPAIARAVGLEKARGAMVSEIMKGSSADRAGIRAGDIITAIGETPISRAEELPRNVARHAPGSTIAVHLLRDGKAMSVKAKLDKLEAEDASATPRTPGDPRTPAPKSPEDDRLGIEMEDHPKGGVAVTRLTKSIKGLAPGDRIVEVNGNTIQNTTDMQRELSRAQSENTALLKVIRGGHPRYVGIPMDR